MSIINPLESMNKKTDTTERPVRVIAVSGGKGGIGKTTLSINLAVALSQRKQSVMLLDGDFALANIDVLLGLKPKHNISHVLHGECRLEDIILQGPEGISLIPAASGLQQMSELNPLQHAGLIRAFEHITHDVDFFLVDTAAGIASNVVNTACAAQEIIMVVCNDPASITDAYAEIKVLNRVHGLRNFKVISNMTTDDADGQQLFSTLLRAADRFLDVQLEYLGALPFDENIRKAARQKKTCLERYPGSKASIATRKIAGRLLSQAPNAVRTSGVTFFLERLLDQEKSCV